MMSEFREKLVALERGQATVSDVKNALRTQVATAPEKTSEAQQLLDAALKAGMPEAVYTNLTQALPVQEDPDATLFSGSDWAKTEVLMPDAEEAKRDLSIPGVDIRYDNDATQFSRDTTVMAGARAAALDDDTTHTQGNDAEDAIALNPGVQDVSRTGLDLDADKTLISSEAISDAFDILAPEALEAADTSRQQPTGPPPGPSSIGDVEFREGSLLRNRFILETKLGEGGMGAVWKGIDKLKQEARDRNPYVAIKLLQGDFKDHPEAFIALQRETSKQQRLAHPNIATVHDFDRDDASGTVFMTMEVLNGNDLAAHIRKEVPRDGLPYEEAMRLIRQLAFGLAHAHSHDLVHSDLKPGNCFVTNEGAVKLLDFGIARASSTKDTAEGDKTLFDPGELGALTPAYATIEMFDGGEPDPRDDIYAMAIIAYQLFTGKHPYGKKNAKKAEEGGLTVPPVAKLTKSQNRTLAQGLAFRRENRTETVEALLTGLEPKKSQAWLWGSAAAVIIALGAAIGVPKIIDYLDELEREKIIARMLVPSQTKAAFQQAAQLPDEPQRKLIFTDPRTEEVIIQLFASKNETNIQLARELSRTDESLNVAIEANKPVQDSVIAFYRDRASTYFDPVTEKYDYGNARSEIAKLLKFYGELKSANDVERAFNKKYIDLVQNLEKRLDGHIQAGRLLNDPTADDVFDVRSLLAKVAPDNQELKTDLLPIKAIELVRAAIDEADFEQADTLLKASLGYAPSNIGLADLRYQVERELERQKNAILVAQIETRLKSRDTSFTSLSAFQDVFNDLIRLAALAPESSVLADLQDRLTDAFGIAMEKQISAKSWLNAETLLLDFAKLFPLDYLDAQRTLLSETETEAGHRLSNTPAHQAAVTRRQDSLRELLANPEFDSKWEIALQVPFKELIALLPAGDSTIEPIRRNIADQYIGQAEVTLQKRLTSRAKSLVARGEMFYPSYERFTQTLQKIAQTDTELAREQAEIERIGNVGRLKKQVDGFAQRNETAAAEKSLAQLEKIATAEEVTQVDKAKAVLSDAFGRLAELTASRQQWGQALKLVDRGLELRADNTVLSEVRGTYDAKYQKVREVELLKAALEAPATITASNLATRVKKVQQAFPEQYEDRYREEFTTLAMARFARNGPLLIQGVQNLRNAGNELAALKQVFGENNAKRARSTLDQRLLARTKELQQRDAVAAVAYQKEGLRILPDSTRLRGHHIPVASKEAEIGISLAEHGQVSAAEKILLAIRASEPRASNLPRLDALVKRKKSAAQSQYNRFDKFAKRRLEYKGKRFLVAALNIWKDNAGYKKRLNAIATPTSRYACVASKAGKGARNRSTCHDAIAKTPSVTPEGLTIGQTKGPILVVVPAGGGSEKPFAISKLEISVSDYNAFCRATSCALIKGDVKLPATRIALSSMEAYAAWLSEQTSNTYRLPSDGEWQHAATAGGKQPKKRNFNCTVILNGIKMKGHALRTALAGQANGWGLINYIGNAKELVRGGGSTIARGGSFTEPLGRCKISLSEKHSGKADPMTGFRLVRELD